MSAEEDPVIDGAEEAAGEEAQPAAAGSEEGATVEEAVEDQATAQEVPHVRQRLEFSGVA